MNILPSTDLADYVRVMKMATKPDNEELMKVSAVAGAGIVLVGFVGFLIFFLMSFIPF